MLVSWILLLSKVSEFPLEMGLSRLNYIGMHILYAHIIESIDLTCTHGNSLIVIGA